MPSASYRKRIHLPMSAIIKEKKNEENGEMDKRENRGWKKEMDK
jgi:hypothetical protein